MAKKSKKAKKPSKTQNLEAEIASLKEAQGRLATERATLADALYDLLRDRIQSDLREYVDDVVAEAVDDAATDLRFDSFGF